MAQKRFKITPSSYIILIKDNKILLSRRFNTGFRDGYYSLVAGHVEEGESFTTAIVREAKEEANIKLIPKNLEVVHVANRCEKFSPAEIRYRVDVYIKAKSWQGKIKNLEPNKCDDLSWFPINKLPPNIIPYIRQAINNIRKKIFYSEFGYNNK